MRDEVEHFERASERASDLRSTLSLPVPCLRHRHKPAFCCSNPHSPLTLICLLQPDSSLVFALANEKPIPFSSSATEEHRSGLYFEISSQIHKAGETERQR